MNETNFLPTVSDIDNDLTGDFTLDNYLGNNTDYIDSFLGIGKRNKQKKAEKKVRKAEKQLEKGHIKAAARKMRKAEKILNPLQEAQQKLLAEKEQLKDINQTKQVINATDTKDTESPDTSPGQIGANAGSTTMAADSTRGQVSNAGGGGGGEVYNSPTPEAENLTGDYQNTPEDADNNPIQGVTVTAKKGGSPVLMIIGILLLLTVLYFAFKKK